MGVLVATELSNRMAEETMMTSILRMVDATTTMRIPVATELSNRMAEETMMTSVLPMADATTTTNNLRTDADKTKTVTGALMATEMMVTMRGAAMVNLDATSLAMGPAQHTVNSRRAMARLADMVGTTRPMSTTLEASMDVKRLQAMAAPKGLGDQIVRSMAVAVDMVDKSSKRAIPRVAMADRVVMSIALQVVEDMAATIMQCLAVLVEMMRMIGAKDMADDDVEAMIEMRVTVATGRDDLAVMAIRRRKTC